MSRQEKLSYAGRIRRELTKELARMNKKKKRLKYKLYRLFVLPVFIVILAVKVLRTYLHLKMRRVGEAIGPVPAYKEPVETEYITPEPVVTEPVGEAEGPEEKPEATVKITEEW